MKNFAESLKNTLNTRVIRVSMSLLVVIIMLYYVLNSITLIVNSTAILYNTKEVMGDTSAVKVEGMSESKIFLSNCEQLKKSNISDYIRTCPNTESYYVPEDKLSVCLTYREGILMCIQYFVAELCMFGTLILYKVFYKKKFVYLASIVFLVSILVTIGYINIWGYALGLLGRFILGNILCIKSAIELYFSV